MVQLCLAGFFTGVRPQGLQKTEEMVREGVLMTGIGELAISEDQTSLRLQPSQDGLPFFLTSLPLNTLTKKLESEKQTLKYAFFYSLKQKVIKKCGSLAVKNPNYYYFFKILGT